MIMRSNEKCPKLLININTYVNFAFVLFVFRHITADKFYVESKDSKDNEILVIDRVSQEISLQGRYIVQMCVPVWYIQCLHSLVFCENIKANFQYIDI